MALSLPVEHEFLDPQFGLKYIGYPGATLVVVALLLVPVSRLHAFGVLLMALGYVAVGIGFVATLLFYQKL
ncbi:MAG: hypothetical protein ABEH35_00085 [Haloarculaceae archaeon]